MTAPTQTVYGAYVGSGATATVTITSPAVGSQIVVGFSSDGSGTITGFNVTDNGTGGSANTYTQLALGLNSPSLSGIAACLAPTRTSGPTTITVTLTGTSPVWSGHVWAQVWPAGTFSTSPAPDKHASGTVTNTGLTSVTFTNGGVDSGTDVVWTSFQLSSGGNPETMSDPPTGGATWTTIGKDTNDSSQSGMLAAYRVNASSGGTDAATTSKTTASVGTYTIASLVIATGGATPTLLGDDFGELFGMLAGDDDFAGAHDEAIMAMVTYDSKPVVATVAAIVQPSEDDVSTQPGFYEGYEDPDLWVMLDFSPVVPNAPPLVDDTWPHFDEYAEDWYGEHNPEDSDPAIANASTNSTFYGDDAWPHFDEYVEDWLGEHNTEDSDSLAPTVPAVLLTPEDPWDWSDDATDDDLTDDGFNVQGVATVSTSPPDDVWDWQEDVADEDFTDDGSYANASVIVSAMPVEDVWPHFEEEVEDTDLTDDGYGIATVVPQTLIEDAWDHWSEEVDDQDLTDDGYNVQAPYLIPPPEDVWDHWSEEAEDWLAEHNQEDDDPLSVNYGVAVLNVEDAWDHWSEELGEDTDLTDDGSNIQNPSVLGVPYLNIEDAWDHWSEELGEDTDLTDDGMVRNPNAPPPPVEDAWDHWSEELAEDTDLTDDGAYASLSYVTPPPPVEDAWDHWSEELGEDVELTDDGAVRNPNVPTLPPEDAWPHDDFAEDEWDGIADPVGLNYVPPSVLLCPEDAWDWFGYDDEDYIDADPYALISAAILTSVLGGKSLITLAQATTSATLAQATTVLSVTQSNELPQGTTAVQIGQAVTILTVTQALPTITVQGT